MCPRPRHGGRAALSRGQSKHLFIVLRPRMRSIKEGAMCSGDGVLPHREEKTGTELSAREGKSK